MQQVRGWGEWSVRLLRTRWLLPHEQPWPPAAMLDRRVSTHCCAACRTAQHCRRITACGCFGGARQLDSLVLDSHLRPLACSILLSSLCSTNHSVWSISVA